jgi:hypothetical protein
MKEALHRSIAQRIRIHTLCILENCSTEGATLADERLMMAEELLGILQKSRLEPDAIGEIRKELAALVAKIPASPSDRETMLRSYLEEAANSLG